MLTTNSSLSVLEPGDSGSTTMDIEVCVMLDSTPGEIDRDIDVNLNTNAATAGQLKHYLLQLHNILSTIKQGHPL